METLLNKIKPWLLIILLNILKGDTLCSSENIDRPPVVGLVAAIDLQQSQVYINGLQNGKCVIYSHNFTQIESQIVCQGQLIRLQKIPGQPCFVINCKFSIKFYCYEKILLLKNEYNFSQSARGFLLWPYYHIYSEHQQVRFSSESIKKYSCQITQEISLNCSTAQEVIKPLNILSHSEKYMACKIQIFSSFSKISIYHGNSCPKQITLPLQILCFTVDKIEFNLYFATFSGIFYCGIEQCAQKYFLIDALNYSSSLSAYCMEFRSQLFYISPNQELFSYSTQGSRSKIYSNTNYPTTSLFQVDAGLIAYKNQAPLILYELSSQDVNQTKMIQISCPLSSGIDLPTLTSTQQVEEIQENQQMIQNTLLNQEQSSQQIKVCIDHCQQCLNISSCEICQYQYQLIIETNTCQQKLYLNLISSALSVPQSGFIIKIILSNFLDELWFYEYHDYQYNSANSIFQLIGAVNRNKFLPFFIKDSFGEGYETYSQFKKNISESRQFQVSEKFSINEKQLVFFSTNTSKMYIENYLFCLLIYLFTRVIKFTALQCQFLRRKLHVPLFSQSLLFMLIDAHTQFVMFMFFHQLQYLSYEDFIGRANIIFTCCIGFIFISFAFGAYPLFSYLTKNSGIEPNFENNALNNYFYIFFIGSGRKLLLGIIQSFYAQFTTQIICLSILNIVTSLYYFKMLKKISNKKLPKIENKKISGEQSIRLLYLSKSILFTKFVIYALLTFFTLFGLDAKLNLFLSKKMIDEVQLMCLCLILTFCLIDFFRDVAKFIWEIFYFFWSKIMINNHNLHNQNQKQPEDQQNNNQIAASIVYKAYFNEKLQQGHDESTYHSNYLFKKSIIQL